MIRLRNSAILFIFCLINSSLNSQKKENPIEIANRLMYVLNYEQAVEHCAGVLKDHPKTQGLRVSQAYALFKLGKNDEALKTLEEESSLFPKGYEAYLLSGYILFQSGRFEEAAKASQTSNNNLQKFVQEKALIGFKGEPRKEKLSSLYEKLIKDNPNLGLPSFVLGLYHKKNNDFAAAKENFNLAYERGYSPVRCYLQLIDIDLAPKKWDEGLKKTQEAFKVIGSQPELSFIAGYIFYQQGEMEIAITRFKEALSLKPYFAEAMINLAIIHHNQGKREKALALLEKALRLEQYEFYTRYYEKALSRNALWNLLLKEKKYQEEGKIELTKDIVDKVELEYRYPLKADLPFDPKAIMNEGALSLVREGKSEQAIAVLREFLKIDDTSAEMNYNLGQLYNSFSTLDKALKYALRTVELKPDFKDAYDLIGNIFFKIEDYEKSLEAYKEVIRINSSDAMGYYNLGCVYSALKDFKEAENCWLEAIAHDKEIKEQKERKEISENELVISVTVQKTQVSFQAHKSLGWLYLDQGSNDKALRDFEEAIKLQPGDAELYYEIGKIYQAKSDIEKAIFYYEKYIYSGGKEEEKVKKLLLSLKKK